MTEHNNRDDADEVIPSNTIGYENEREGLRLRFESLLQQAAGIVGEMDDALEGEVNSQLNAGIIALAYHQIGRIPKIMAIIDRVEDSIYDNIDSETNVVKLGLVLGQLEKSIAGVNSVLSNIIIRPEIQKITNIHNTNTLSLNGDMNAASRDNVRTAVAMLMQKMGNMQLPEGGKNGP